MRFDEVAQAFENVSSTRSRIDIVNRLADLLARAPSTERGIIANLALGQLMPPFEGVETGLGEKTLLLILAKAYGSSESAVLRRYQRRGDLGLVAQEMFRETGIRPPRKAVSVRQAQQAMLKVTAISGAGATARKIEQMSTLLRKMSGIGAKYLVRILQGRLRLGASEQALIEAIAQAALGDARRKKTVERAYNVCSSFDRVTEIAFSRGEQGLDSIKPVPGIPVRSALAQRSSSASEVVDRLGAAIAEPKYDGFRLQVHKKGKKIWAFSRRMENVTAMFPDIADAVLRQVKADEAILEGEAIAYHPETGEFLPFQVTVKRKRKYLIEEMVTRYPLRFFAFDLLDLNGKSMIAEPLTERRKALVRILRRGPDAPILVTEGRRVQSAAELQDVFDEMIQRGLEGVIAKRPDAPYHAGARNYNWVKLKRFHQVKLADTIDIVVVGYFMGRGNRARFGIGSLLGAVYDPGSDRYRTLTKVGSGFTEKGWQELKRVLDGERSRVRPAQVDSLIVPDVWISPKFVVTVVAEEITRSPAHTCGKSGRDPGFALRFPRATSPIRADKGPEDATTEREVLEMYEKQWRRGEKKAA